LVHYLDGTPRHFEQGVQKAEAEARQAILVLDNDQADALISSGARRFGRASLTPEPIYVTTFAIW
jgi:hypothetical protein